MRIVLLKASGEVEDVNGVDTAVGDNKREGLVLAERLLEHLVREIVAVEFAGLEVSDSRNSSPWTTRGYKLADGMTLPEALSSSAQYTDKDNIMFRQRKPLGQKKYMLSLDVSYSGPEPGQE